MPKTAQMHIQHTEHEEGLPSYLGKLTQAPLLTAEEELSLTAAARKGDAHARGRLVESNMRLVINIAKNYRSRTVALEDLIQEGAIGLMQAIERFEPERGYRFSTYASHWIRQAIGRALDNKSKAIRLPAHVSQSVRRIERERLRLARELGKEPTTDQIAVSLGMSPRKLVNLLQCTKELLSLDMKVGDSESVTLGSLLADETISNPEQSLIAEERIKEFHLVLMELSERERRVVAQRLKLENNEEISTMREQLAKEMHISRERIRQIELQAIKKLRAYAQRQLPEFLRH